MKLIFFDNFAQITLDNFFKQTQNDKYYRNELPNVKLDLVGYSQ